MIILRYIFYVLACQFFILRLVVYYAHRVLVFISKPGARLVIPLAIVAVIYFGREIIDQFAGREIDAFWNGAVHTMVGEDLFTLLYPWKIELSALIVLVASFVVLSLVSSMLRPLVGTFSAPQKPLPPLEPMTMPDTSVKPVKAKLVISPRRRNKFKGELSTLMARVPEHLQRITQKD